MTAAEFREATRKLEAEDRALEKKADRWQSAKDSLAAAEKDYGSAEDAAWIQPAAALGISRWISLVNSHRSCRVRSMDSNFSSNACNPA